MATYIVFACVSFSFPSFFLFALPDANDSWLSFEVVWTILALQISSDNVVDGGDYNFLHDTIDDRQTDRQPVILPASQQLVN